MNSGQVKALVILGVNAAYYAPADLKLWPGNGEGAVRWALRRCIYDETAQRAHWHVNAAHYLESWSDARASDGTISIVQPMIDPLYGGKTAHDSSAGCVLDNPQMTSYEVVQANFKTYAKGGDATAWQKALHDGWVEGTAFEPKIWRQRQGCDRCHVS